MEKTRLSQLLKIISREHAERRDLGARFYDPRNYHKQDRKRQKYTTRQEDYRNRSYMANKNLNKLGK